MKNMNYNYQSKEDNQLPHRKQLKPTEHTEHRGWRREPNAAPPWPRAGAGELKDAEAAGSKTTRRRQSNRLAS